jgi:conjugal transfer pilus assembly protein TraU
MIKKLFVSFLIFYNITVYGIPSACKGRFLNPVTDICWSCLFPMFIGPIPMVFNVGNQKGGTIIDDDKIIPPGIPGFLQGKLPAGACTCPERDIAFMPIGLMMSYYEPSRFVDVTRTPFCMVGLGGIDMSAGLSGLLPAPGYGDEKHGLETKSTFYQTHFFIDPIMVILGIIDTGCNLGLSKSIDLMFMSEVDPTWNDDSLSIIFSPEVILFSSLPAQLACGIDCIGSSLPNIPTDNKPIVPLPYYIRPTMPTNPASASNPSKFLFWCGGCQGSLYPFDGNNSDSIYPIQTSILSAEKVTGLVHRMGLEDMTTGVIGMCNNLFPDMFMDKSEWKYSIGFPVPQTAYTPICCNSFGETDALWNSGASFPYTGEDFSYVLYHERDCCFL